MSDPIQRAVALERRRRLVHVAIPAVLGVAVLLYALWYRLARHGGDAWQLVLIALVPIGYAVMLVSTNRQLRRIVQEPRDVTSIYERSISRNNKMSHALCFEFCDGKTEQLSLRSPLVANPSLRDALRGQFPQSAFKEIR